MSNDSSALYQNRSNVNQDLPTLPALLLYFHGIFVTVKQIHNVNFKNDALCKTHAAVFKGMVQMYLADLTRAIYILSIPAGINYCLYM